MCSPKKKEDHTAAKKGNFDKRQPKFTTTTATTTTAARSWLIFYPRSWPLLFYHEVCCNLISILGVFLTVKKVKLKQFSQKCNFTHNKHGTVEAA